MACYLGIRCWEARRSLLNKDCMQGIQMWHIRWGLDARNPDVLHFPGAAGRDEKQGNVQAAPSLKVQVPSWLQP